MNLNELKERLNKLNIDPNAYSLTGSSYNECYVISNEGPETWEVYYSERGAKSSRKIFDNEAEACEDLLRRIEKDPTVKIK